MECKWQKIASIAVSCGLISLCLCGCGSSSVTCTYDTVDMNGLTQKEEAATVTLNGDISQACCDATKEAAKLNTPESKETAKEACASAKGPGKTFTVDTSFKGAKCSGDDQCDMSIPFLPGGITVFGVPTDCCEAIKGDQSDPGTTEKDMPEKCREAVDKGTCRRVEVIMPPRCSSLAGKQSADYPCMCGTTDAAKMMCEASCEGTGCTVIKQVCTATSDDDAKCTNPTTPTEAPGQLELEKRQEVEKRKVVV